MSETTKPCIRGCTYARRHVTDCEDRDACRGCLPVTVHASTSLLCERCHLRLSATLSEVPAQHALLLASVQPSQQINVRPQLKHGRPPLPTESEGPRYIHVHGAQPSAPQEGEPLRIVCLDTAQDLADMLSEWVEHVCEKYAQRGPDKAMSTAEREGRPRWSNPPRLEVDTAARWLRTHLLWLEQVEGIGDMMEGLSELMGQAHALAPWREESKRVRGIPCPECYRHTLVQFGGRDTVTCQTVWCRAEIPQGRYLIWARMYEEEAG